MPQDKRHRKNSHETRNQQPQGPGYDAGGSSQSAYDWMDYFLAHIDVSKLANMFPSCRKNMRHNNIFGWIKCCHVLLSVLYSACLLTL